jgi:hypothetical protein
LREFFSRVLNLLSQCLHILLEPPLEFVVKLLFLPHHIL